MKISLKKKNRDFLIVIIFLILLFTTFIVSYSLAKYITKINGQVFGTIAKPIVELKGEESLLITAIAPKTSYAFEVRNYNKDGNVNEVEMQYYIEIISEAKNIKFELYDENEKLVKIDDKKTSLIEIPKEKKQEHKYRLDILYNNDVKNLDIKDNIEIKIHSIQKI